MLYDMVCAFHGGKPVCVRPAHLIFNQDDQTFFIAQGVIPGNKSEWGLVATSSLKSSGTNSIYHHEDSEKFNGIRVKRHLLVNGRGDTAPPVYCFSGLTDRDMPHNDFIEMRNEGLCVGGYAAGHAVGVGYVFFMKGKKGAEKARFERIRDTIFLDFARWSRMEYDDIGKSTGWEPCWRRMDDESDDGMAMAAATEAFDAIPIEEEHRIVAYSDGDMSQNQTITSPEGIEIYSKHGIIANKHNASGTGKEQGCDLGKVFPVTNQLNKKTTVKDVPSDEHRLKRALEKAFTKHKLVLNHKKTAVFVDFLSVQLTILTRAQVPDNIVHGMVENGMLDAKHKRMPVLQKLISLNKKVPTREVTELYISSFGPLRRTTTGCGTSQMKHHGKWILT